MKLFIAAVCGMAISAHAQFNIEINNGIRIGVLGGEVINVGGNNKNEQFNTGSWPIDVTKLVPTIPQMSLPFVPPPPSFPGTPLNFLSPPVESSLFKKKPQNYLNLQPEVVVQPKISIKPEAKLEMIATDKVPNIKKNQEETQQINQLVKSVVEQQIESPKKPNDLIKPISEIKQSPEQQISIPKQNFQAEKQREQKQRQDLKRMEDQKLAEFIKLMPEPQKQHLRAISTAKTQI